MEPETQPNAQTSPTLSAKALALVRPEEKTIELVDGFIPGLRVRVLPDGTRVWSLNVRDSKGVRRRFDVGRGLALGEARRKAEGLRRAIREGADPTRESHAARQRAQAARDGVGTFKALLDNYFGSGPGARQRRALKTKRLLKTVLNTVLHSALLDLDRATLQLTVDGWSSQQTAALAVRSLRPCLKWAEKRARPPEIGHAFEHAGAVELGQQGAGGDRLVLLRCGT